MNSILAAISGKKTYISAGATVLYCVLGVLLHFMTVPAALAFIGTAGSLAALRAGVGKAQTALEIVLELLKIISETTTTTTAQIVEPALPLEPALPVEPVAPVEPVVETPVVE